MIEYGSNWAFSWLYGGIDFGQTRDLADMLGMPGTLPLALASALMVGPAAILASPSSDYLITVLLLRLRGRSTLRLMAFLEEAHRAGVLSQAGPVYRFRHTIVQERLATGDPGAASS